MRIVLAGGLLALVGCGAAQERGLVAQYDPVPTREAFIALAVGPEWSSEPILVRFDDEGGISGTIDGTPVTGIWTWQGALLCTEYRAATSGGEGCFEMRSQPGEMLAIPLSGNGRPFIWTQVAAVTEDGAVDGGEDGAADVAEDGAVDGVDAG